MDPSLISPQYAEVIKSLEKFGFKFFGYSENKEPLLIAPNGQVVPLNVAYDFVKTKLVDASKSGGSPEGGIEAMPVMPIAPEVFSEQVDQKIESAPEKAPEKEKATEPQTQTQSDLQVKRLAPKIAVTAPEIDIPFGDGFFPRAFKPTDVTQAQKFVASNAQRDDKTTEKWLAVLWDKFLKELSENS